MSSKASRVLLIIASVVLAFGSTTSSATAAPARTWKSVSVGYEHTCAIDSVGHLFCWGSNSGGALGLGTEGGTYATPQQVGTKKWASVVASPGNISTCAIDTKAALWCWGDDHFGQLGVADVDTYAVSPVKLDRLWSKVAMGDRHTCGIEATHHGLFCWGNNDQGELGIGTTESRRTPRRVGTGNWKAVGTGSFHTCAIAIDNRTWCWGADDYGQLGDGRNGRVPPALVPIRSKPADWKTLTVGSVHNCIVNTANDVYCWGGDLSGQIGSGGAPGSETGRLLIGTTKTVGAALSAGGFTTCGISTTHVLRCWGENSDGEVGDGTQDDRNVPTKVATSFKDWSKVSTGFNSTCAIRATGALYCWGGNDQGQLGVGDLGSRTTPTRVN